MDFVGQCVQVAENAVGSYEKDHVLQNEFHYALLQNQRIYWQ